MFKAKTGDKIKLLKPSSSFEGNKTLRFKEGEIIYAFNIEDTKYLRGCRTKKFSNEEYCVLSESEYEVINEEWEIGKWYEFINCACNSQIGKLHYISKGTLKFEPWIINKNSYHTDGYFNKDITKFVRELKVEDEEIQKHLPLENIDKIKKFIPGRWYKYTREGLTHYYSKYSDKQNVGNRFYYDEQICGKTYVKEHNWSVLTCLPVLLENLDEIQPYLPKGHMDLCKVPKEETEESKNQLLREAERLFPIGTKFHPFLQNAGKTEESNEVHTVTGNWYWAVGSQCPSCYAINSRNNTLEKKPCAIYHDGKWARKVEKTILWQEPISSLNLPPYIIPETPDEWKWKVEVPITSNDYIIGIDPYEKPKFKFDEEDFLDKEFNKTLKLNIKQKTNTIQKLKL